LQQAVERFAGRYRERIYAPLTTLSLFMGQALSTDGACQDAVARHLSERSALGAQRCSLNTGPYCRARERLSLDLIVHLQRQAGLHMEQRLPQAWRWRGRSIKLLDGTTLSMPDTPANQQAYPQSREQKPRLGFPLARLVALISLGSGAVLDWAMGASKGKGTGEHALFRELFDSLRPGDVVVADRFHCTYWNLAMLSTRAVDLVSRQHARRLHDFRRGKRLGRLDHIVQWQRPARPAWMDAQTYALIPETLPVRETRVGSWMLVSTMLDPAQATPAELDRLYRSRWNIEVDLRSIKAGMGMDILRCKSPAMVKKEVAVHLLAYTLARAVMAQAASLAQTTARCLSFRRSLQILEAYHQQLRHAGVRRTAIMTGCVLGAIAQLRLIWRPSRIEPRAIKRRPKPHDLLLEPRDVARAKIAARRRRLKVVP
jgi:Transposase DDE domain